VSVSTGEARLERQDIAAHPLYVNPHIRMCSVITRAIATWGNEAEALLRSTYRRLGRKTGNFMMAAGVVRRGVAVPEWGRVSEEIMDLNGLDGWARLEVSDERHDLTVPGCKRYTAAYRALGAPKQLCGIPFEWDNGCLDAVNPQLQVWPGPCAYRGAEICHYVVSHRPLVEAAQTQKEMAEDDYSVAVAGESSGDGEKPVAEAPDWTNPLVGLLAIVSALSGRWPGRGELEVKAALEQLGALAGQYLLEHQVVGKGCGAEEWLTHADRLWELAGFYQRRSEAQRADSVVVVLEHQPYLEPLRFFDAPADIFDLITSWDRGCLSVVSPGLELTWEQCAWRDGTATSRVRYSR
jgi:hypothetical protein